MSVIRSNLKISFFSFLTAILLLVSINHFLKSDIYLDYLSSLNGSGYFYLTYDWQKKFIMAEKSRDEEATLFLGSSRTSNSINPLLTVNKAYNLGLMAGSYKEIELLSSYLVKINKKKYKSIFLELNPMSATDRHIKAMSNNENKEMLQFFISTGTFQELMFPILNNEIFLQRFILNDLVKDVIKNTPFPDNYARFKRNFHTKEFRASLNNDYLGFAPSPVINSEFAKDFFSNCSTMTSWSLNNQRESFEGLTIFKNIIMNLKKISDNVIVWIPPVPKEHAMVPNEEKIFSNLKSITIESNVKLTNLANLIDDSSAFYDCIHVKKENAELVTKTLLKSSVNK